MTTELLHIVECPEGKSEIHIYCEHTCLARTGPGHVTTDSAT